MELYKTLTRLHRPIYGKTFFYLFPFELSTDCRDVTADPGVCVQIWACVLLLELAGIYAVGWDYYWGALAVGM